MSLTLRLRDADQLTALIAEQQDPASPRYHRWLTPRLNARFAPSPEEYAAVVDRLRGEGFASARSERGAHRLRRNRHASRRVLRRAHESLQLSRPDAVGERRSTTALPNFAIRSTSFG
jgi:hypothetical protein